MNIKLATVNMQVSDPERSKQFYIEALGMTENVQRSHAPGFVYLESPGCHLTLATADEPVPPEPSPTLELGFEVDDVGALAARFAERGVLGFQPQSMGWGEVIEGRDPDGHRIIVYALNEE